MRHLYRPHSNLTAPKKYSFTRRSPWHPDLDDIMFYLQVALEWLSLLY